MASADLIRESQDPSTSAARLAELAQIDRDLWPAIAVHPAAYPALLDWLGQQGDPTVNAVLALRAGSAATTAPTPPPPPAAEAPTTTSVGSVPPTVAQPAAPLSTSTSDTSKSPWLLAGMVAVVLLLIGGAAFGFTKGFGGDDDKEDEATPALTVDAPELSARPSVGVPDADSEADSGSGSFCEKVYEARDAVVGSTALTPGSTTATSIAKVFGELEELSPADIKADIAVMADYFETMSDPANLDTSTISERVKEFTAASKNASAYFDANCN